MSVSFVYVNGVLNLVLGGKSIQITNDHPLYKKIKSVLATATEEELLGLIEADYKSVVKDYVETNGRGKATVINDVVYFNGKPVHNTLANRISQFCREGLPFEHLLRFMENAAMNPSYTSMNELFDFLENKNLPITEDGYFLAYKAINADWKDKYSNTIDNSVGNIVEVMRNSVDDNRNNQCSYGLHVGALEYVYSYGSPNSDRIIIVKVHPKDAVSVPKDSNFQKLRCCRYEVICEFQGEMSMPLYKANGQSPTPIDNDADYDWSFADDNLTAKDVKISRSCVNYHNKRDSLGRFCR